MREGETRDLDEFSSSWADVVAVRIHLLCVQTATAVYKLYAPYVSSRLCANGDYFCMRLYAQGGDTRDLIFSDPWAGIVAVCPTSVWVAGNYCTL